MLLINTGDKLLRNVIGLLVRHTKNADLDVGRLYSRRRFIAETQRQNDCPVACRDAVNASAEHSTSAKDYGDVERNEWDGDTENNTAKTGLFTRINVARKRPLGAPRNS